MLLAGAGTKASTITSFTQASVFKQHYFILFWLHREKSMPYLNYCVHQREINKLSRNLSKEVSISAANVGKYAEREGK